MFFCLLKGRDHWFIGKLSELRCKQTIDFDALASGFGVVCPTDGLGLACGHASRQDPAATAVELANDRHSAGRIFERHRPRCRTTCSSQSISFVPALRHKFPTQSVGSTQQQNQHAVQQLQIFGQSGRVSHHVYQLFISHRLEYLDANETGHSNW